jgi:hypothetical protein
MALKNVLAVIRQPEARITAWTLAGPRLATVFFRFNIAGILFTALELSGTWLYNRYNLSRHDRWLHTTPWSQDSDERRSLTLGEYQENLHVQVKAPKIEVRFREPGHGTTPPVTTLLLHLPTTAISDLMKPLRDKPAKTVLRIGCYRVRIQPTRTLDPSKGWAVATEALVETLLIKQAAPLIVEFEAPTQKYRAIAGERDEVVIVVELGDLRPDVEIHDLNVYYLRVPLDGDGDYISDKNLKPVGETCSYYLVDPLLLPQEED